jgi:hypothetical protein
MRKDFVDKCRLGLQKYGAEPGKYCHKSPDSDKIIGCCAVGGYLLNLIGLPEECDELLESRSISKEYLTSGYVSGVITGFDNCIYTEYSGTADFQNGYEDGQMLRKEFVK